MGTIKKGIDNRSDKSILDIIKSMVDPSYDRFDKEGKLINI